MNITKIQLITNPWDSANHEDSNLIGIVNASKFALLIKQRKMTKILNIVTSIKGDASFSNKLANAVLEKIVTDYPGTEIHTHDLNTSPIPHLEELHFSAFSTPEDLQTTEQKEALKYSENGIRELMEADVIVIGVPVYNFSIPSTLKAWIDHIVRAGVTFTFIDGIPQGLVKGKKVYLSIASGAIFSEGPMKDYDFVEPYLRTILGFIGMTDITVFRAEGTMMPEFKDNALPKAFEALSA